MQTKIFEIRDRMTLISALAVLVDPAHASSSREEWHLKRCGYGAGYGSVLLTYLDGHGSIHNDPYEWSGVARTMPEAHKYIMDHWFELKTGDLIDVEHILKESAEPKKSEFP